MHRLLPWLEGWRLALLLMAGAGIAAAILGPDRSWDTRNYHLYTPWALLFGRPGDILAAGMQGFHNPTLDIPAALLLRGLNDRPRLLAFLLGAPTGIVLWLVWRLARQVFAAQPRGAALAWLALAGAAGGAVLRSEVGTLAGDTLSGGLVLAALVAATGVRGWRGAGLAGLACGAAIGLKLTNAPYAPALALLLVLLPGAAGARLVALAACAAGGLAGVLLAWGWWGGRLWAEYGNPLFPYFQHLLVPGWEGGSVGRDTRFLAADAWDALTRPFRWAVDRRPLATEEPMRDPRIAAGMLAALALPVLAWRGAGARVPAWRGAFARVPGWRGAGARVLAWRGACAPGLLALAAFFLLALAIWSALFGIYRYAFVLEALAPILVLGALAPLRRALPIGLALVAAAAVATIPVPSGRGRPAPRYLDLAWPALPPDAVVLATDAPVAFAALGLPEAVPMASLLGIAEVELPAARQRLQGLIAGGRPLYLLAPTAGQGWERLPRWGLEELPESCRRLCTNWSAQGVGPALCAARRPGEAAPPGPAWSLPRRLCEAAGPGLESGGQRGLGLVREGVLDFGPACAEARLRLAAGEAALLAATPPGRAEGAVLTLAPPPDGVVRLVAQRPLVIAEAACIRPR